MSQRHLVYDWAEKWLELCDLVNNIIWPEQRPFGTYIPAEAQETRYQGLHLWFLDHQWQFLPLWRDYISERIPCQDTTTEEIEAYLFSWEGEEEFIENPFRIYFGADNLHTLIQELDSQSGMDTREFSNQPAADVIKVMIIIGQLLNGFVDVFKESQ